MHDSLKGQRLLAVFLLGVLLLNFPLLYLFSSSLPLAGVPLLFIYVFVAWGAIIALLVLVIERTHERRE
jgi:hypothetical protein